MGLSLGTAAAGGLRAPEWVWIATAIVAGLCAVFAVWHYFMVDRKRSGRFPSDAAPEATRRRVGIRNHPGARSTSRRARFGSGLDSAIENMPGSEDQPGGESHDEDSAFE